MWIGSQVNSEIFRNLFGINSMEQVDGLHMEMLPAFDNELSNSARNLLKLIRKHHHPHHYAPMMIVKQGGISEPSFRHYLCESKSPKPKSFTYMEFLCFLHKSTMDNL